MNLTIDCICVKTFACLALECCVSVCVVGTYGLFVIITNHAGTHITVPFPSRTVPMRCTVGVTRFLTVTLLNLSNTPFGGYQL